jgi:elongation factor 1-beta
MGEVAVTLTVMPNGVDVDLDRIKNQIEEKISPKEIREKPIAFGLKSLEVLVVVPDAVGGSLEVEKKLSSIPGVASVETTDVTLL